MGQQSLLNDILQIGEQIANLRIAFVRIAFNLREGVRNIEMYKLPDRVSGKPPPSKGQLKCMTIENDTHLREYFQAMGWNPETGDPRRDGLERLNIDFTIHVTD